MNYKLTIVAVSLGLATVLSGRGQQPAAPAAVSAAAPTAAAPAVPDPKAPVAKVNATTITRGELDGAMRGMAMQLSQMGQRIPRERLAEFERDVLNEVIGRELLVQEGRTLSITNLDALVSQEVERVTTQAGGKEKLDQALADAKVTREEYLARVRDNLVVQEALRRAVVGKNKATDKDAEDFYAANRDKFKQPQMVKASHILIRFPQNATDTEKAAKKAQLDAIRDRLKKGEDFATLAKQFSEDPGSAPKGGDLDFFPQGMMVPEFDAVAFSLQTNQLSEVIMTAFGYHVLLVTDRKAARDVPLAEVKERLLQNIQQQKDAATVREHVDGLRKTAKIDVLLPPLPAAPAAAAPPAAAPAPAPAK